MNVWLTTKFTPGGRHQGGRAFVGLDVGIGAMFEQQSHQCDVAGEGRADEGGLPIKVHPVRAALHETAHRSRVDTRVGIRALGQQCLDQIHRIVGISQQEAAIPA